MAAKMRKHPEIVAAFKNYVDALKGESTAKWAEVAYYLKKEFNYTVYMPNQLPKIYDSLFNYPRELNLFEISLLVKLSLKEDFAVTWRQQFQKLTNSSQFHATLWLQRYFVRILQVLVNMLSKDKTLYIKQMGKIHFRSLKMMLNLYKVQYGDPVIDEVKEYSILLRSLYQMFADNIELIGQNRAYLFEIVAENCNRQRFNKIIFYLQYVNLLKQINERKLVNELDMCKHPLLMKNINDNMNTPFYKYCIEINDYKKKYDLYNECLLNGQENIQIDNDKLFKKPINHLQNKVKTKPRFGIAKTPRFSHPGTIQFKHDDITIEQSEQDIIRKQRRQQLDNKLNDFYSEAFQVYFNDDKQQNNNEQ